MWTRDNSNKNKNQNNIYVYISIYAEFDKNKWFHSKHVSHKSAFYTIFYSVLKTSPFENISNDSLLIKYSDNLFRILRYVEIYVLYFIVTITNEIKKMHRKTDAKV